MSLEVLDFFSKNKVHATKENVLLKEFSFLICLLKNGQTRGLEVLVPKRYHFYPSLRISNYNREALKQYNLLIDYLATGKGVLINKWNLTEAEYTELMCGIRLCLAKKYGKGNLIRRVFVYLKDFLKVKMYMFRSKIK